MLASHHVDIQRVRLRKARASTRFFTSLGILLIALAAMALFGLRGLADVNAANRQVFHDNFLTAEATSRVATSLARVDVLTWQALAAPSAGSADQLRLQVGQIEIPHVNASIAALMRLHVHDPTRELAQIERIPAGWRAFVAALTAQGFVAPQLLRLSARERDATAALVRDRLAPLITFVTARQSLEIGAAADAHGAAVHTYDTSRAWLIALVALGLLAAASMIRSGLLLKRLLAAQTEERRHGETTGEYSGLLQATVNEGEAHDLVRRQIERTSPGARAVVLARNNSDDRLEPRTSLDEFGDLRAALEQAVPRSCLAVRFGRGHAEGGERSPLTSCELCGRLPGVTICEPLLVGGEVIGSVLVNQAVEPSGRSCERIRDTVAQAAPVLANLRNLAIAELRAATDRLTGLPNQRAVQDTLKRMVAHASRTISPLAAVLVDLDHFKDINDVHGHDRGDEVLAAVGVAFRSVIRDSDFVGRYGGEEFLLLLPATDADGALQVAEAVRAAIASIRMPRFDQPITASAGVALLPADAGDAVTLFRAADRALYAAKNAGRNRTHLASDAPEHGTAVAGPTVTGHADPDTSNAVEVTATARGAAERP